MSDPIKNRYDFVLFFDVLDGNPNGDPDAGNLPRIDPETGHGLVSDVCLKRKIRNRIQLAKAGAPGYDIFIRENAVLNDIQAETCQGLGSKDKEPEGAQKKLSRTARMCAAFFDIRTFGAVLTTDAKGKDNLDYTGGQVRGPVQFTFARSIDPIVTQEHSITRMAVTKAADAVKERTMGRKNTVPYGLYRAHGFIVPSFAARTGFSEEDLAAFWEALRMMFNEDPSAARGTMAVRRIVIFKHDSALGNAPAVELFDRVKAHKVIDGPARAFADYAIDVDADNLPAGVTLL